MNSQPIKLLLSRLLFAAMLLAAWGQITERERWAKWAGRVPGGLFKNLILGSSL
jgi:hypothetical protein